MKVQLTRNRPLKIYKKTIQLPPKKAPGQRVPGVYVENTAAGKKAQGYSKRLDALARLMA